MVLSATALAAATSAFNCSRTCTVTTRQNFTPKPVIFNRCALTLEYLPFQTWLQSLHLILTFPPKPFPVLSSILAYLHNGFFSSSSGGTLQQ
ncbi:DNA-directed RNA polymerase [Zea mays]|uniref:DNA-directed RNA polymerase n=1 Tax=Zea mays TaxID=4577 RepID=A0A1D6IJX0_MAIZE|nr:DNA-directed RNA polymerase [Zea mays]